MSEGCRGLLFQGVITKWIHFSVGCFWNIAVLFFITGNIPMLLSHPCEEKRETYSANCSNRKLKYIPWQLFEKIKELDLSNNQLSLNHHGMFANYRNLKTLYLRNNSISMINKDAFKGLNKLQRLDLQDNDLTRVPAESFLNLNTLLILSLSGNRIFEIEKNAFQNLSSLIKLYLDSNSLQKFDVNALAGLKSLQLIDIHNNTLTFIDADVFKDFRDSLMFLSMHDNPWKCDCHLRWLRDWLIDGPKNHNIKWQKNGLTPRCSSPESAREKSFSIIESDLFACEVIMYSSGTSLVLKKGENVSLTCKLVSDPPATITWFKGNQKIEKNRFKIVEYGKHDKNSTLLLNAFDFDDIGFYKCRAKNSLGNKEITYSVTLEGVDPDHPSLYQSGPGNGVINERAAIISAYVIAALIFLTFLLSLFFFLARYIKRKQKEKDEDILRTLENHLKTNGIAANDSKTSDQLNDTETDPLYDTAKNENTYISFKSDHIENDEISQLYAPSTVTTRLNDSQTDISKSYPASFWAKRDDPHSESTSPLLGNYVPAHHDVAENYFEPMASPAIPLNTFPYSHNILALSRPYVQEPFDNQTLPHTHSLPHRKQQHNLSFSYVPLPVSKDETKRSASVGSLGMLPPPKKPPRLHSTSSIGFSICNSEGKLSFPQPGSVDQFGTAV